MQCQAATATHTISTISLHFIFSKKLHDDGF
jgi:hypothetical protein